MIKPQNPQRGDVVITQAVDGFWEGRRPGRREAHVLDRSLLW